MEVRFCAEIKTKLAKGQAKELYDRIEKYGANVIDLGTHVYIIGKVSYPHLSAILFECLAFGVVDCEVGKSR